MKRKLLVATIFLGSFISFALEPMIGRALLPVFGGTPTVWVTCLGAFQILMVGGYLYAEKCSANHVRGHSLLLGVSGAWCLALAFIAPSVLDRVSSLTGVAPFDVFISVLAIVGFAFILLAANATIVQSLSGGDYRLYAISNLGSLLGLFAYPVLIEPFVGLSMQWLMLGTSILFYSVLLLVASRKTEIHKTVETTKDDVERPFRGVLYFVAPALSCALLNAVTTHLTLDVAPLPLLWAFLLGLFLASYIIGFSGKGKSAWWAIPAAASVCFACWWHKNNGSNSITHQLSAAAILLLFVCTFLHSWLYEARPASKHLGRYYLLNVIGGAVGGCLTSILAPLVFSSVIEYPVMIAISAVSIAVWAFQTRRRTVGIVVCAAFIVVFGLTWLRDPATRRNAKTIHSARGFFGTIHVDEVTASSSDGATIKIHEFYHGETVHGVQVMRREMEKMPTCYFTPYGVGFSIWGHHNYRENKPMRVNLLGLGMGVLFAYERPGDYYRAYEISPETLEVAKNPELFAFVPHASGTADLVLGDARKGLEKELADGVEPYDVIIVDAFSGDNVPFHLSTKEAIELYFKMLKPDGILCIHFTNKHLNLAPYIKRIGMEFGIEPIVMKSVSDEKRIGFPTDTAIFTRHPEKLRPLPVNDGFAARVDMSKIKPLPYMPTDDKGSFLPLVDLF